MAKQDGKKYLPLQRFLEIKILKMRRNQWIVIVGGIIAVVALYAFGKRVSQADTAPAVKMATERAKMNQSEAASFKEVLKKAKEGLSPELQMRISRLENSVTRGDVKQQQILAFHSLTAIWDSLGHIPIAAHYRGEEGKLENSEKTLTFAANLFLIHQQHAKDPAIRQWQIQEARDLLEHAVKLAPESDSVQIALAKAEVASGTVMQGVQRLLKIVKEDPDNIGANMTLGQLSITSGQYAKAVDRLKIVVDQQPGNVEALYYLAEAYKNTGKKDKAIELFEKCKTLVKDPGFSKEIDDYINSFK